MKKHPVNESRIKRKLLPANAILCRGAGTIPKVKTLSELYGIKAACIAAVPLIRGVCKVAGMKLIDVKGATGTIQTDLAAKAKAAVEALKTNDFVLLHVKATDVASHDGNAKLKISLIEKVDSMISYVLNNIDLETTYMAVTADHTTSTLTGKHEGDPVPIVITGYGVRSDDVEKFDERSCAKGGLNRIEGKNLMPIIMGLMGKTKKFGA